MPPYYTNRNVTPRTTWTLEGLALSSSKAYKNGEVATKPGIHFVAIEPSDTTYFLFPAEPENIFTKFFAILGFYFARRFLMSLS